MKNSKGTIFYGMHFYPGVAEYRPSGKEPFRVYLNEQTIRKMDPTFAGRPVFVGHVDEVNEDVDALKAEADGWVIESFFNAADGKHWSKFIVVSEKAEEAIKKGWRLSNCYVQKGPTGGPGYWNGVEYEKEIKDGEYHHLAIVPDPRYEESVILTPEQFKEYNERLKQDLVRLANDKSPKEPKAMKFKLFKREKVENSLNLEEMLVVLPKSKREISIANALEEFDALVEKKDEPQMANGDHLVEYGGAKMTLNELLVKHQALCDELDKMKSAGSKEELENEEDDEDEEEVVEVENEEDEGKVDNSTDPGEGSEETEEETEEAEEKPAPQKKVSNAKAVAKKKAKALEDAPFRNNFQREVARVETTQDQVQRGISRYGS